MPMSPTEKRKKEQEKQKSERIRDILECSFGLFAEQGIESITMNEIARQAEIGVASLYRYFTTKDELLIETAVYAWKMEMDIFKKAFAFDEYKNLDGFSQLRLLLETFSEALVSQGPFFRFIYYFDAFVKKARVESGNLKRYEQGISEIKQIVVDAFEKGKSDGSITFGGGRFEKLVNASMDELYFTVMHSLFSMSQKLSLSGDMLEMNQQIGSEKQIVLLIEIILSALK